MRIDTTILPPMAGPMSLPEQPGRGLSFESVVQAGDNEADVKAAPVLSQNVVGFNVLGVLGLGGPAGVGRRLVALPQGDDAVPVRLPAEKFQTHMNAAPAYASVPYAALTAETAVPVPVLAPAGITAGHARTALPVPAQAAALLAGGYGLPLTSVPAVQVQAAAQLPQAAGTAVAALRALDAKAVEVASQARRVANVRFVPEADPAPGQVSVAASEDGEQLHIVAAAPALTDGDRHTLKTLAEETAAEAGVTLGDLRLNGVVVRQLSRTR